jgi:hypothetical protein
LSSGYLYSLAYVRGKLDNSVGDADLRRVVEAILESGRIGARDQCYSFPNIFAEKNG